MSGTRLTTWCLALVLAVTAAPARAAPALLGIIIDDLGDRWRDGLRAVDLPGPVTASFLPRTPYAAELARRAHANGKEVMLHLPMESVTPRPLGPGGVTLHMTRAQFLRTLRVDLQAVPFVRGINNHMGSLLTRHPGHMGWLMGELNARGGLYFVDSRTTTATVALAVADEHGVPAVARDVFLDNRRDHAAILGQLTRLIAKARRNGFAVGIGHPYPETLAVLEGALPLLAAEGVELVPVSGLIAQREQRRTKLWHASLSPSPPDSKNLKP